jgi:outer membrane protein insertion porin family
MPKRILLLLSMLLLSLSVHAADGFKVRDIQINGLQRISSGTVFDAMKIDLGDQVTPQQLASAAQRLYGTGYFRDIRFGEDNGVLVVNVVERPSIGALKIEGDLSIDADQLLEGLKSSGLAEGEIYQESTLASIRKGLIGQYSADGRYDVRVETDVKPQPRNRVAITIKVEEGQIAKIKRINIVGNEAFEDEALLDMFELKTGNWLSWYRKDNLYSTERLNGDLEKLRSYYYDRGYVRFQILSQQVSVTPDNEGVHITITVREGARYKVGKVSLKGELPMPEETLRKAIFAKPGEWFSRRVMTSSSEYLGKVLGSEGYFFANVNEVPVIHDDTKLVDLSFFIEPGQKVYVRNINFAGNTQTADEVLRREMRQPEGGKASNAAIEHSKLRLERLGFFESVTVETPAVPGRTDQIDVLYNVVEQPSGNLSASLGYSDTSGLVLGGQIQQKNFLGTGNAVNFNAQRSESTTTFSFGIMDPYYTPEGVSAGFNLFYRKTDYSKQNIANYDTDSYGGGVSLGYPLSETSKVSASINYRNNKIKVGSIPAVEIIDFVYDSGDLETCTGDVLCYTRNKLEDNPDFDIITLVMGWHQSTLNRGLFPTRGYSNRLGAEVATPLGDLSFYKLDYDGQFYYPLSQDYIIRLAGKLGYGDGYGDTEVLPFFEHFYSGRSARGYESNTFGPRTTRYPGDFSDSDPFGGNLLISGKTELIFPLPYIKDQRMMRASLFVDGAGVFNNECPDPDDDIYVPELGSGNLVPLWGNYDSGNCGKFAADDIRFSAGVGMTWVTPFAPISFSLAHAINPGDEDETKAFQFTLGQQF